MMFNATCNSTLDDLRILPTSEKVIVGSLTFHKLALIIAGASTLFAILMSFYLIMMHALHYTKPREQKHIIRILFMVPIYASASFLSLRFYPHAIYFQVISDCYEAFAISSFFALLCHYMGPDVHEQKEYFRLMYPVKPWVWPLDWFAKCCGGQRGPWRTPKSGLTWFNIIWIGIYHYCFIRVAMTITAVVTQYFGRYCESSNSPVFSHIWVTAINAIAVTIAMYCVIQFYVQLRGPLAEHKPFLKVLAIKLVIFLSFWQTAVISVATSSLNLVHANDTIAYPDIKVGVPSLLLCVEMAFFAILHLWAFPYRPYLDNARPTYYPVPGLASSQAPRENEHHPRAGGFLGLAALWDAVNVWDVVKAFGRGMRWLFVGVKHRHEDASYLAAARKDSNAALGGGLDMDDLGGGSSNNKPGPGPFGHLNTAYAGGVPAARSTDHLPIATEFRRSRFGGDGAGATAAAVRRQQDDGRSPSQGRSSDDDDGGGAGGPAAAEHAGLIAHAQPNPRGGPASPPDEYVVVDDGYDDDGYGSPARQQQGQALPPYPPHNDRPTSLSTVEEEESYSSRAGSVAGGQYAGAHHPYPGAPGGGGPPQQARANPRNSTQAKVGNALWGPPGGGGRPGGQ